MKKLLMFFAVILVLVILFFQYLYRPLLNYFGVKERAGIKIESNQKAKVYIDNIVVGNTPYQDENLKEGEVLVKVVSDEKEASSSANTSFNWQGKVKLSGGTLTVVNRELGDSIQTSSGEVITLEKGNGATIVTTPNNADVMVDGKFIGKSSLSIPNLSVGEHQFVVSHDNFLRRTIRATVVEGYNLTLIVDLSVSEAEVRNVPTPTPLATLSSATVKNTPNGFLRVRSAPNTTSSEVGRLKTGESVNIIEKITGGWTKVSLKDGKEGYVSSAYLNETSNQ